MQTNPTLFPTVSQTCSRMLRQEGVLAFWKGSIPTAMGMICENAMAFGVNAALGRYFADKNDSNNVLLHPIVKPFVMGALTGCCSALVLLPSELVKAKLQVCSTPTTTSAILKRMMKEQGGMRSFCVGLDAQLARDGVFYAVFFGSYELLCRGFEEVLPRNTSKEWIYFLSGGFAGCIGWTVAMPFDVPKTNVQARYDTAVWGSYLPEMKRIVQERGIVLGLYQGLGSTLVRAFPANAALFLGIELGKKCFDEYMWR